MGGGWEVLLGKEGEGAEAGALPCEIALPRDTIRGPMQGMARR